MKTPSFPSLSLFALFLPLCLSAAPPQDLDCAGCVGGQVTETVTGSGPTAGESLSILITTLDGSCYAFETPYGTYCKASGCVAEVTYVWSGLVPDSDLTLCTTAPPHNRKCSKEVNNSGPTGSGTDTDSPLRLPCTDADPGYQFSMESSRGLKVTATAKCTGCKPVGYEL